ncbi:hypothetical protein BD310DRAFT_160653 [Dichomitus squalens]|uniref:Uncharacterized protein n=1 Tax=Dichomitus squalens TaxID=114155 RepID=A0A4Q9PHN4_9APHY|nr:hypothetical protein BD310DRAFT_160653 [Dichomitus squalens]
MYVQWTAHSKSLLERFLPNVPFPDVELCTSKFSLVAAGRGDVAELALSRLEHQLAMYQARGIRLSYKACQNGVLTVYERRVEDVDQAELRNFDSLLSWIKAARGVARCLESALSEYAPSSGAETNLVCHRGKYVLSRFATTIQGLDRKAVGCSMSAEEREAGRFVHSFSYVRWYPRRQ